MDSVMHFMHPRRLFPQIRNVGEHDGYLAIAAFKYFGSVHFCEDVEPLLNHGLAVVEVINALVYFAHPPLEVSQSFLD